MSAFLIHIRNHNRTSHIFNIFITMFKRLMPDMYRKGPRFAKFDVCYYFFVTLSFHFSHVSITLDKSQFDMTKSLFIFLNLKFYAEIFIVNKVFFYFYFYDQLVYCMTISFFYYEIHSFIVFLDLFKKPRILKAFLFREKYTSSCRYPSYLSTYLGLKFS